MAYNSKLSDKYRNLYADDTGKNAYDLRQEWDGKQIYHPTHKYIDWLIAKLESQQNEIKSIEEIRSIVNSNTVIPPLTEPDDADYTWGWKDGYKALRKTIRAVLKGKPVKV